MRNGFIDPVKVDEALTHLLTLKIFIHFKMSKDGELGVRETLKAFGKTSTAGILYHFQKLADVGLVHQLPNNRYQLTEAGKEYKDVRVPIYLSATFIRGMFIPRMFIVIALTGFSILVSLFLVYFIQGLNPLYVINYLIISALIAFGVMMWQGVAVKSQFESFYDLKDNN